MLVSLNSVTFLVNWCCEIGFDGSVALYDDDKPASISAFCFLIHSSAAALADSLLCYVPPSVKSVLGRSDISPADLFDLPVIPRAKVSTDGGYYLSFSTMSPDAKSRYPTAVIRDETLEAGIYGGSTMNKIGFPGRIYQHEHCINQRKDGIQTKTNTSGKHYDFAGREDAETCFLLFASIPVDTQNRPQAFLLEGLFQAYLDSVCEATFVFRWHRPATSRLISAMRAAVPTLPTTSLGHFGLNAAWSLRQGGFTGGAPFCLIGTDPSWWAALLAASSTCRHLASLERTASHDWTRAHRLTRACCLFRTDTSPRLPELCCVGRGGIASTKLTP